MHPNGHWVATQHQNPAIPQPGLKDTVTTVLDQKRVVSHDRYAVNN